MGKDDAQTDVTGQEQSLVEEEDDFTKLALQCGSGAIFAGAQHHTALSGGDSEHSPSGRPLQLSSTGPETSLDTAALPNFGLWPSFFGGWLVHVIRAAGLASLGRAAVQVH